MTAGPGSSPAGSTSSTSCQCNAGYTGPNGGACTRCASGHYKDSSGDANCDSCPSGFTSPPDSTSSQSFSRYCAAGSTGLEKRRTVRTRTVPGGTVLAQPRVRSLLNLPRKYALTDGERRADRLPLQLRIHRP